MGGASPGATTGRLPFVGRRTELERLRALSTVGGAAPAVAVVTGEAGVGKTALAQAHAAERRAAGAVVVHGRCDEGVGLPYQPFVEALRGLVAGDPELIDSLPTFTIARLAALLPELDLDTRSGSPLTPDVEPSAQRHQLFRAVTDVFRRRAEQGPVVLVLDDLQWASPATVLLLRHFLREQGAAPVETLALVRPTGLAADHPLLDLFAELRAGGGVVSVALEGLDARAVAALLEAAGREPVGSTVDELLRLTRGNAFFVSQLVAGGAGPGGPVLPPSLRDAVMGRVDRLPEPVARLLTVAAVRSAPSDLDLLRLLADDPAGAPAAVAAAATAGLVEEDPTGGWAFTHGIVRDVLLDATTTARRAALHRRVAEALVAHGDRDDSAAEVVHHLDAAGVVPATVEAFVDHCRRAARWAASRFDFEAAADLLGRARGALAAGEPDGRVLARVLVEQARAMQRTGAAAEARAAAAEAARIARSGGSPELLAEAALAFEEATWTGEGFVVEPVADGAEELLTEAIAAVGDTDPERRGLLLSRLPRVLCFQRPSAVRAAHANEATALGERTGSPALAAAALEATRWALWGGGDVDRMLEVSDRLVAAAEAAHDALLLTRARIWRFLALVEGTDGAAVEREIAALHELGELCHDPFGRWMPVMATAMRSLLAGRLAEAEGAATEALVLAQELGLSWAVANFGIQLAYIRREQGRLGELEAATEQVAERFDAPVWRSALADLYSLTGRLDRARPIFERFAAAGFSEVPDDPGWLVSMTILADVCAELGDLPRAEQLLGLLRPHAGRLVVIGPGVVVAGSAARATGRVATVACRFEEAEELLRSALAVDDALGARPAVAHTYAALAVLEHARGEAAAAAAHEAAATAIADDLGLVAVHDELARARSRPPNPS